MQEKATITIGFHYVNGFGEVYDSSSTEEVFYDLGYTELSAIAEKLNAFLAQCGWARSKPLILMDEEEYDAVEAFLAKYREGKSANED